MTLIADYEDFFSKNDENGDFSQLVLLVQIESYLKFLYYFQRILLNLFPTFLAFHQVSK